MFIKTIDENNKIKKIGIKVLLVCLCTNIFYTNIFYTNVYADKLSNYLFRDINFNQPQYSQYQSNMLKYTNIEEFKTAHQVALSLETAISTDDNIDSMTFAKVISNTLLLKALAKNRDTATTTFADAVRLAEFNGRYNLALVNILTVKGYSHRAAKQYDEATNAFRRAQHILHRHAGVYAEGQLPIIEAMTSMDMERGHLKPADREQRFFLKVSEEVYGSHSEKIIPTLQNLGRYFANRASSISKIADGEVALYRETLFRESIALYERSIAIIEDKYNANDMRLIEPLKGLSKARFLQGSSRTNTRLTMERATKIIATNPSTDTSDHAKSLVELGDIYTITLDTRSIDIYAQAWTLLGDSPENKVLRDKIFGEPKRLFPDAVIKPVLVRQPANTQPGEPLYVDLKYDVRQDGRVRNIKVIAGNVPNGQKKLLRNYVSSMRYRPRMVDGVPITTEGLNMHQLFAVSDITPGSIDPSEVGVSVEDDINEGDEQDQLEKNI